MKPVGFILLPCALGLLVSSCRIPEYDIQEFWLNEYVTVHFADPVILPFDLSSYANKYPYAGFEKDCKEICEHHHIPYTDGQYSYSIEGFDNVLTYLSDYLPPYGHPDRAPSIELKINCLGDQITKTFREWEVSSDSLTNIRVSSDYQTHSLTIKSHKTTWQKVRIVWDKPSSGFNDESFIGLSGNVLTAGWDPKSLSVMVKCDSGPAARPSSSGSGGGYDIIPNTLGMDEDGNYYDRPSDGDDVIDWEEVEEDIDEGEVEEGWPADEEDPLLEDLCEDDNPVISPTLLRPIYSGGRFQNSLRWRVPVFFTWGN